MIKLISYNSIDEYLGENEVYLERDEIVNSLILGFCYGITNKSESHRFLLLSIKEDSRIVLTAIHTSTKFLLSVIENNQDYFLMLSTYLYSNNVTIKSIVGEYNIMKLFVEVYNKSYTRQMLQKLYALSNVLPISFSEGTMDLATPNQKDILAQFLYSFQEDSGIFPKHSKEHIQNSITNAIRNQQVYVWVQQDIIVSMSAIIRKTKHVAFISWVYTPNEYRGKGYAICLVHSLSKKLLADGYTHCALFADAANPISNGIYLKIGYSEVAEFLDITY